MDQAINRSQKQAQAPNLIKVEIQTKDQVERAKRPQTAQQPKGDFTIVQPKVCDFNPKPEDFWDFEEKQKAQANKSKMVKNTAKPAVRPTNSRPLTGKQLLEKYVPASHFDEDYEIAKLDQLDEGLVLMGNV